MSSTSYSLNGKENLVAQKASYAMTDDTTVAATMEPGFMGTHMSILAGANNSSVTTNYGKAVSNDVHTAWSPAERGLASDVLSLDGMSRTLGSEKTDEYVLSMSYIPSNWSSALIQKGDLGLVTRSARGIWVNAVTKNFAVTRKFVLGPWNSSYKLGTYGVDTATNTAWAVLNYNGDFAVGAAPLADNDQ
jgi:hypothetical protein